MKNEIVKSIAADGVLRTVRSKHVWSPLGQIKTLPIEVELSALGQQQK